MLKNLLRIGISIGVSFAILALLLQLVNSGLSDLERPSVLAALQATSLALVLGYFIIYLITLFFRAYRYRLLLSMSGEPNVPTLKQMALVTGIRNMVVDMLPARLGELGYVGLLNRGYGVKLEHCGSSLAVSIAFDFIALLVVVFLIIAKQLLGGDVQGWALGAMISAVVLCVVALAGLFVLTPWANRFIAKNFSAKQESGLWFKLTELLNNFSDSLSAVRNAGKTTQVIALSVIIRILKYAGMYMLFQAVAGPSFKELADLPLEHTVGALIGGEIGASLPVPTFMSFGAYEAGGALVFQLLGVSNQAAAVVTLLSVHIWSQLMEYILGGILLATFIFIVRRAKDSSNAQVSLTRKRVVQVASFIGAGGVLAVGSGFLAYQLWAATKLGALSAPAAGQVSEDANEWRQLSKDHVRSIDGFVVFSSNRDGNHDIFKLDFKTFELSKLTSHPNTETYPRISPDGSKLVFARAHQVWMSQRNSVAWDIYVLDIASGKESKVASNGTAPAWVDNESVTYLQESTKVTKVNIGDLSSTVLYESGVNNAMPKGAALQNPKYNPTTGEFVFTGRQNQIGMHSGHWGTALSNGDTHRGVHNGCEIAWNSAGTDLFQVTTGGRDSTNRVVKIDKDTLKVSSLIDLEGEFTHEYWPKESSNGEYMVIGASRSRKEHEHDVADYEIFLWKAGSQPQEATRLTFHTGNDNWPDVFIR